MNLDEIAHILSADLSLNLEEGVSLFVDTMAAECAEGVLLRMPLDGVPIDWNIPGYHKFDIQAIVRSQTHAAGRLRAAAVMAKLTFYRKLLGDGSLVQQMLPNKLPIVYPRSDGNGIEWSIDISVVWHAA